VDFRRYVILGGLQSAVGAARFETLSDNVGETATRDDRPAGCARWHRCAV